MNEFKSAGNDAYITTVHQTVESFFIERYVHFFYLRVWCTPRYVLEIGSWFGNCRHMDAMDVDQDSKEKDVETVTEEETTKETETGIQETDRENEADLVKETATQDKETETDAQPAKRRRQQRCV